MKKRLFFLFTAVLALFFFAAAPASAAENSAKNAKSRVVRTSWYGIPATQGKRMSNGERFDRHDLTAAHRTLPFGTQLRLRNPDNGKTVTVEVTDRGPFIKGRELDVCWAAAKRLGILEKGVARIQIVQVIRAEEGPES